jgi:predicted nucleic acid-binding protein
MNKFLIDTNVVLDVLLRRVPFYADALMIFALIEDGLIQGCISASAFTDIHYLLRKAMKDEVLTQAALVDLRRLFSIVAVTEREIDLALSLGWSDFEDAVQFAAAVQANLSGIISRNTKDYQNSIIAVYDPATFLKRYNFLRK